MSVTTYDPAGTLTAGNFKVTLLPTALVDLNKPSAALLAAGIDIQCALESFGTTTDVGTASRRKLCDTEETERIAKRTRKLENLTITGDKTDEAAVLAILTEGAKIGIAARPYDTHGSAWAVGDRAWVFNAAVAAVDPASVSTTDGEEFGYVVQFLDVTRDITAVAVA